MFYWTCDYEVLGAYNVNAEFFKMYFLSDNMLAVDNIIYIGF